MCNSNDIAQCPVCQRYAVDPDKPGKRKDTIRHPMVTPCGHVYCQSCLKKTLHYSNITTYHGHRCAMCREQMPSWFVTELLEKWERRMQFQC